MLNDRAMLATLQIGVPAFTKRDRKATAEVHTAKQADADAGYYSKVIIARERIKAVTKIRGEARTAYYRLTLPWTDDGQRLLATEVYTDFMDTFRELANRFDAERSAFLTEYPAYVQAEALRLGELYNAADYPTAEELERKFKFDYWVEPLTDADDIRVAVDDETRRAIEADLSARFAQAEADAMREVYGRLLKVVRNFAEAMERFTDERGESGKRKGTFRDSIVGNVERLCDLMKQMNVGNDPHLDDIADRLKSSICTYDPEELRRSKRTRELAKRQAEKFATGIEAYMGGIAAPTTNDTNNEDGQTA